MNAERLHAIALALKQEMAEADTPNLLNQLVASLRAEVASPSEPGPQQEVSRLRSELNEKLAQAPSNGFSPTWREALEELGITDLVGDRLREQIESIFERNVITPSAAADELAPIAERVQELYSSLDQLHAGFKFLSVGAEELEPGEVEIGFLIPRKAVREDLELLGMEFIKLEQILGPFAELATGTREAVRVRTISSSSFAAFLESAPATALIVASAMERLIAAYKNVLEIRVARQKLKEAGASDKTLKAVSHDAEASMEKAIGKLVTEMLKEAKVAEPARKNELRMELKVSLNGLANRIDKGYSVDVRVGELPPPPGPDDENAEPESKEERAKRVIVQQVQAMQESLKYTNPTGEPILSLPESTADTAGGASGRSGSTRTGRRSPAPKPPQSSK
jgi:hypothetical protein